MTRALAFIGIGFVALTLIGPLLALLGIELVAVDVTVVIVLYLALAERRSGYLRRAGLSIFPAGIDAAAMATTLCLGYLADLLGGGPKGISAFALGVLYLTGRALARQVSLVGALSQAVVAFCASVGVTGVGVLLRWAVLGVSPGVRMLMIVVVQAGLTAAVAPPLVRLLRWIDGSLARDAAERVNAGRARLRQ